MDSRTAVGLRLPSTADEAFPVIAIARQQIAQQRIHPAGEPLEDHRPGQARKPIGKPLGAARVFELKMNAFAAA